MSVPVIYLVPFLRSNQHVHALSTRHDDTHSRRTDVTRMRQFSKYVVVEQASSLATGVTGLKKSSSTEA